MMMAHVNDPELYQAIERCQEIGDLFTLLRIQSASFNLNSEVWPCVSNARKLIAELSTSDCGKN